MKRIALLLLALVSFISVYSQPEEQIVPEDKSVRHGVLPNGLTYYVQKSSGKLACFCLLQKTGSLVETEEERGMAHFLEHMAFKGTKHFPGNSVTQFLERLGMKHGADDNASTTYDVTQYMLYNVPTDNKTTIDSCLQILRDISADVTIDKAAMDAERSVIEEERRIKYDSLGDETTHDLYAGTVLEKDPIGRSEVILNCTQDQLMAFYKKWYQPQNQIVIVAAPYSADGMVGKISALFGDLDKGETVIPGIVMPQSSDVPKVSVVRSKNAVKVNAWITTRIDNPSLEEMRKVKYFEQMLVKRVARNILNERFSKIENGEFMLDMRAYLSEYLLYSKATRPVLSLECAPDTWRDALEKMLTEVERMKRFGPTDDELEDYLLPDDPYIKSYKNCNKIKWKSIFAPSDTKEPAGSVIGSLVINSLTGNTNISDWSKMIILQYTASNLTSEMVRQAYKDQFSKHNCTITIVLPEKSSVVAPTKEEILALWNKVEKADLTAEVNYPTKGKMKVMLTDINPTPGTIVSTAKGKDGFEKEYTLSNGIKVMMTKGDGNAIYASMPGGKSLLEDAELPYYSLLNTTLYNYDDIQTKGVQTDIGESETTYFIGGESEDLEVMFMVLHSRLTSEIVDSAKFVKAKNVLYDMSQSQSIMQERVMKSFQYVSPVREYFPYTKQILDTLSIEGMKRILRRLHRNYNGMVLRIAATDRSDIVLPYIEKYIASLPSEPTPVESVKREGLHFKDHDDKAVVYSDDTNPKANISLFVGLEKGVTFDKERNTHLEALGSVLGSLLLDRIRVNHSDVYTIGVSERGLIKKPFAQQWFRIEFPCAPEKMESILADVKAVLREAADGSLITQQHIDSYVNYKKKMLRGYKPSKNSEVINADDMNIVKAITVESLRNFLKDMLDNGHTYEYAIRTK